MWEVNIFMVVFYNKPYLLIHEKFFLQNTVLVSLNRPFLSTVASKNWQKIKSKTFSPHILFKNGK